MVCETTVYRKDVSRIVIFDLIQFIHLFDVRGLTRRGLYKYFEEVRNCWITENMDTIWQLSAKWCSENRKEAIGNDDMADKSFFIDMLHGLIGANPKYKSMLNLLS